MILETIEDVSDEIERCARYIFKQLGNLTKRPVTLNIGKEKGIINELILSTEVKNDKN